MNIPLDKRKVLKVSLILAFILLFSYFAWDMSLKVRNSFLFQGYGIAISELMVAAEDPQCQPFPVLVNEKTVYLIIIECLNQPQDVSEIIEPEIIN